MKAKIIQRAGIDSIDAIVEIEGVRYLARDRLNQNIREGDTENISFSIALANDYETVETIISGNKNNETKLEHISGTKYRAYGKVLSTSPLTVDCGITTFRNVFPHKDNNLVGQFIEFEILILNAHSA